VGERHFPVCFVWADLLGILWASRLLCQYRSREFSWSVHLLGLFGGTRGLVCLMGRRDEAMGAHAQQNHLGKRSGLTTWIVLWDPVLGRANIFSLAACLLDPCQAWSHVYYHHQEHGRRHNYTFVVCSLAFFFSPGERCLCALHRGLSGHFRFIIPLFNGYSVSDRPCLWLSCDSLAASLAR
jgi:hypothetical protein